MRIGLIGMSGVGKTHWANQLTALGSRLLSCDDMIAGYLAAELGRPVSFDDLNQWLGLPYEPGFQKREAKFLSFEAQAMASVLNTLSQSADSEGDLVVDMTGSAIYGGSELFDALRQHIAVVYLAITPAMQQRMYEEYARRPRAVVWQGQFRRSSDQTRQEAVRTSYTRLIAHRESLYEAFNDVQLAYATHRQPDLTAAGFTRIVDQALQSDKPVG